jgi:serine protease Do
MKTEKTGRPFSLLVVLAALTFTFISTPCFARGDSSGDAAILDRYSKAFVNVVKKAKPAVVHIKVEKTTTKNYHNNQRKDEMFNHPFFEQFFGPQFRQQQKQPRQREYKQRGQGSGFIISKDGFILTNNHVVEDADSIKVILSDKREFEARVVGTDPQTDVALLKIEDPSNLPVLPLGDSSELEVAEWVIAIGNPFGLSQTVTVGVVSATGRNSVGINEYENFIQTDAAINPGNSGGPLINGRGEVVGINTALFSRTGGYMGIGFAIPINMAKLIENQLQEQGKVTRGWLGVVIQDVDKDLAESFGLKQAGGILVSAVQPGSPASAAGLKQGDIIFKLNDNVLEDVSDLRNQVALQRPGSKTLLHIVRDGRKKKILVTIGEQPANFGSKASSPTDKDTLDQYGLTLQELSAELAEKFEYETGSGLIVSDVVPGSAAARAGLKPGHLVEEVNRQPVNSIENLRNLLKGKESSGKILLRVRSGNYSTYIVLAGK